MDDEIIGISNKSAFWFGVAILVGGYILNRIHTREERAKKWAEKLARKAIEESDRWAKENQKRAADTMRDRKAGSN